MPSERGFRLHREASGRAYLVCEYCDHETRIQVIGNRKSPLAQASIVGLDTFWKIFTRSITLPELVTHLSNRLGIKGRSIIWDRAEPCMDVYKPHQLELLREDLAKQAKKEKRAAKASAEKAAVKKAKATPFSLTQKSLTPATDAATSAR